MSSDDGEKIVLLKKITTRGVAGKNKCNNHKNLITAGQLQLHDNGLELEKSELSFLLRENRQLAA